MMRLTSFFPIVRNVVPRRLFSSQELQSSLPANLKIADLKVIHDKVSEEQKFEENLKKYQFPQLNAPDSIPVKKFLQPGEVHGSATLNKTIFTTSIRPDLILNAIRYTRHAARQPKRTKRISDIRGSNKKPRPQKGTGTGQVGNRRNSAWRGGQKAHGPVLRDYSIKINKKQRALALMMAIAAKYREGNLFVFDQLKAETHRTSPLFKILQSHGLDESLALFVDNEMEENFSIAVRNIAKVNTMQLKDINTYEVVRKDKLAMSLDAFNALQDGLISDYTSSGKRTKRLNMLSNYHELVNQGKKQAESAAN